MLDLENAFQQVVRQQTIKANRTVVLLIDEGQQLRLRVLRQLRKVIDYHVNDRQMVQVDLAGQPLLAQKPDRYPALQDWVARRAALQGANKPPWILARLQLSVSGGEYPSCRWINAPSPKDGAFIMDRTCAVAIALS